MRLHININEKTEKGRAVAAYWNSLPPRARSAFLVDIIYKYLNKETAPTMEEEAFEPEKENEPESMEDVLLAGLDRF